MEHTSMWLGLRSGSRMVVHTPLSDETRGRLERLHAIAVADKALGRVPVAA